MYPLICCFSGFMIFEPNLACSHSTQAHGIEKDKRSAATRRWIPCTWWREINREISVNTRCQEKDSILYKFFLYTNMVTVLHCVVQECVLKCLSFCNRNIWKNYLHICIYILCINMYFQMYRVGINLVWQMCFFVSLFMVPSFLNQWSVVKSHDMFFLVLERWHPWSCDWSVVKVFVEVIG